MKHLFIINPAAGKGRALKFIPEIEELFKDSGDEYIIKITERPRHAIEIVRSYTEQDQYRVYAIGGDGTLNEVLNGMAGTTSILGVIPGGSGNDFIRSIGTKGGKEDILRRTVYGKTQEIDLARVMNRYFINIASAGIDAEIGYNAAIFKKIPFLPGHLSYLLSIFITVFRYKSKKMRIIMDDREINTETLLIAAGNGRFYGGGMMITPGAELSDGQFDICHVTKMSKAKILLLFPRVIKGKHENIKEVSFNRCNKLSIYMEEDTVLNIDGELTKVKKAEFEIIPKGIKVIIPNQI